jgi:hypothetical protein
MNFFKVLICICFITAMGNLLSASTLKASSSSDLKAQSRFNGIKPRQIYTPEIIPLGEPSIKTQAELDTALVKQVTSDKHSKYSDFDNYKKVSQIISEGAYISDRALFSAITKRHKNRSGKDFKSLQLMYLNGEFEPNIFNELDCYDLQKAITPEISTTSTNVENAHIAAEQAALFLSDKVSFKKCKNLLPAVTTNERLGIINLNIAKLLLDQNVDTDGILQEAIERAWSNEEFLVHNERLLAKGIQRTEKRYEVIKFLISSGVQPNAKHLENLFAKYNKTIFRRSIRIQTSKIIQTQFSRVAKLLLSSGATLNEQTKELISEYRKGIDEIKEKLGRKSFYKKKQRQAAEYTVSLYPETLKVFESGAKVNVNAVVKEHSLTKQLHEAVVAKDKRRSSFYLKRGAKGNLTTLRQAITNGMDNVAISIMDQDLDYDSYIIASLAIRHKSTRIVEYLLKKNKINLEKGEDLIVLAAENRMTNTVKSLISQGADPVRAIKISIERNGSNYPSQIISNEGNLKSKSIFRNFVKEEERKSAIAKQEAQERRIAREKKEKRQNQLERQQYLAGKQKGDMVCKDGRMAIFLDITIRAFVEDVEGNNIRVRIADTEGTSPFYNGVTLNKNTIIWDNYQEWRKCN